MTDTITNSNKLIVESGESTNPNTPNGAYTEAVNYIRTYHP